MAADGCDLHPYAAGFREGAETLLEVVRSTANSQDVLVDPIVCSLRGDTAGRKLFVKIAAAHAVGYPVHGT